MNNPMSHIGSRFHLPCCGRSIRIKDSNKLRSPLSPSCVSLPQTFPASFVEVHTLAPNLLNNDDINIFKASASLNWSFQERFQWFCLGNHRLWFTVPLPGAITRCAQCRSSVKPQEVYDDEEAKKEGYPEDSCQFITCGY